MYLITYYDLTEELEIYKMKKTKIKDYIWYNYNYLNLKPEIDFTS